MRPFAIDYTGRIINHSVLACLRSHRQYLLSLGSLLAYTAVIVGTVRLSGYNDVCATCIHPVDIMPRNNTPQTISVSSYYITIVMIW